MKFDRDDIQKMAEEIIEYTYRIFKIWLDKKKYEEEKRKKILETPVGFSHRKKIGILQYEFFRNKLEELQKSIVRLSIRHHTQLIRERVLLPVGEIEEIDYDYLPNCYFDCEGKIKEEKIVGIVNLITPQIYENQIIVSYLIEMIKTIENLTKSLVSKQSELEKSNFTDKQDEENKKKKGNNLRELRERIKAMREKFVKLNALRRIGFLSEVEPTREPLRPTLLFRFDPIYHQIYEILRIWNRIGLPFSGKVFEASLDEQWLIYEYWCLFKIANILIDKYGEENADFDDFFSLDKKDNLELRIGEIDSTGNKEHHSAKIGPFELHYQRYFDTNTKELSSLTISLRPDITIINRVKSSVYIFDSKCQDLSYYLREESDRDNWKGDFYRLHTYRDAIITENSRAVSKLFALTPVPEEKVVLELSALYKKEWQEKWGMGIIYFHPSIPENEVKKEIMEVLNAEI